MDIAEYFESYETVNGYRLMKIVSKILSDLDPEAKELPGPMGYTYLKKGYVTGTKNVKTCTKQEAIEWTEKYLGKRYAVTVTEEAVNNDLEVANEIMEAFDNAE